MRQEATDLALAHVEGAFLPMEEDESPDTAQVGLLGPDAVK
jgi:hypothetical protein